MRLANRKRPHGAADAEKGDQQDAKAFAQAGIARIGHDMDEWHEEAERHQEGADIDRPERAGAECLAKGQAGSRRRGVVRGGRIAVGREAVVLRSAAHEGSRGDRAQHRESGEREVGRAPADAGDQLVRQRRADQRADADAGDRDAAGRTAAALEPALHRRHARHVGQPDTHADTQPVAEVDRQQAICLGGDDQAGGDEEETARDHRTRADPVGDGARHRAQGEVEESRDREDEGGLAALRAELRFQRTEEGGEGIDHREARQHAQERAGDDPPAGKNAGSAHFLSPGLQPHNLNAASATAGSSSCSVIFTPRASSSTMILRPASRA